MPVDSALPVWTIKPNWREGINESLEWLTDVIDADDGSEQTRALRLSPRRRLEMTFTPWDEHRSYFELWLHRLADDEFMVPLWHDRAKLSANVAANAVAIPFDNTNREFDVGGMCLLIGDDPHSFDARTILSMTDGGITLTAGVSRSWLKGATIFPLRRTRLSDESRMAALTSRVATASLEFELNQANDIADDGVWGGALYNGLPIITSKPNYSEALDMGFFRQAETVASDHGLSHTAKNAERAFTTQIHTFRANGRAEQMALRQMLYRLRGRSQYAWLPTFNQDMRLARAAGAADLAINIRKIGYGYTGGVQSGREHILIDGTIPRKINSTGAPLATTEERLNLSAAVGAALPAGRSASFMDVCRLDQDRVEIFHHTDSEGVADCKAAFRSILATRQAPAVLHFPIPAAEKNAFACGTPGDSECVNMAFFDGWYARATLRVTRDGAPWGPGGWYMAPDTGPTIYYNSGFIWVGRVNDEYPNGIPAIVPDPDEGGVTVYFCNPEVMGAESLDLRMQHGAFTGLKKGTFTWQFWNEPVARALAPFAGESGGSPFDVGQLFPQNWYFHL